MATAPTSRGGDLRHGLAAAFVVPDIAEGAYVRIARSLYRVRILIAVSALAGSWALPGATPAQRTRFLLLVGLIYIPYAVGLFVLSKRKEGQALRIAGILGDLVIVFLFQSQLPPTKVVSLFGYLLILAFYAYLGGLFAGLVIGGASFGLTLLAQTMLAPADRLDAYTLVMFGAVLVSMSVLTNVTSKEHRDLTNRIHAGKEELDESEERFRLIVKNVQEYAIYLLDPDGYILSWNDGAKRIKGYSEEEIVGKHFSVFYTNADLVAGKPLAALRAAEATGSFEDEGWRLRKDSTRFWASVVLTPLRTDSGRLRGYARVTRDITAHKSAEDALKAALEREQSAASKLRELDEMKNAFLSAVSHDLRTPLTAVKGFAQTLQRQLPSMTQDQAMLLLGRISENSERLEQMLVDLLDLERTSRGVLEPTLSLTDIVGLVEGVARAVDTKGRNLQFDAVPSQAHVDARLVERIVDNLLVNAVKHTPPSTNIRVAVYPEGGGAMVLVEDNGPGIPPELKESIFKPFLQGPGSHASGSGLGLSLVDRFVELQGGKVCVEDRLGGGSSFRVYLPGPEAEANLSQSQTSAA